MTVVRTVWAVAIVLGVMPGLPAAAQSYPADSAAVSLTVRSYHEALARGDSTAALGLLAADAIILESGGRETREEYRSHHLPADISFAQAVPSRPGPLRIVVSGDIAWASSTGVTEGSYRDRAINSMSAELMVLSRSPAGWVIRAIHWSSRAQRPGS